MRTLGNWCIGIGLALCFTLILMLPGLLLVGTGLFLRSLAPRPERML